MKGFKFFSKLLALTVFISSAFATLLPAQNGETDLLEALDTSELAAPQNLKIVGYTEREVRQRLQELSSCIPLQFNSSVRGYLNTYIYRKSQKTETMLGKRLTYFPIFEQKLKEHGLPADLKYLAVVESALNPKAVSRVGATGLWQFMPETGSEYGLKQNGTVDERSDVVRSTDATMRYLKKLYQQFDDWALALAAYNSGPTRVNNAIKRAHSRNFWRIQRYLPAETANYVPAFIAASYICNFFPMHNLQAENPDLDLQITSYLRIWEGISFRSIADATGIDYQVVKELNPGYKRDYIPATLEGNYVLLPARVMPAFAKYMNGLSSQHTYATEMLSAYVTEDDGGDNRYAVTLFKIDNVDHLDRIGASVGANGDQLKAWNRLESNWVGNGTLLKVWRPVFIQKHQNLKIEPPAPKPPKKVENFQPVPSKKQEKGVEMPTPQIDKSKMPPANQQFQWHTVRRNESLDDIARQYGSTTENLRSLNTFDTLKVGMRLKVKTL